MLGLKGMFWNCEGIRDPAKHDFIQETFREQRLDFLALWRLEDQTLQTIF